MRRVGKLANVAAVGQLPSQILVKQEAELLKLCVAVPVCLSTKKKKMSATLSHEDTGRSQQNDS